MGLISRVSSRTYRNSLDMARNKINRAKQTGRTGIKPQGITTKQLRNKQSLSQTRTQRRRNQRNSKITKLGDGKSGLVTDLRKRLNQIQGKNPSTTNLREKLNKKLLGKKNAPEKVPKHEKKLWNIRKGDGMSKTLEAARKKTQQQQPVPRRERIQPLKVQQRKNNRQSDEMEVDDDLRVRSSHNANLLKKFAVS